MMCRRGVLCPKSGWANGIERLFDVRKRVSLSFPSVFAPTRSNDELLESAIELLECSSFFVLPNFGFLYEYALYMTNETYSYSILG